MTCRCEDMARMRSRFDLPGSFFGTSLPELLSVSCRISPCRCQLLALLLVSCRVHCPGPFYHLSPKLQERHVKNRVKRQRQALYNPPNESWGGLNRMQGINWRRKPLSTAPSEECGGYVPRVGVCTKRGRKAPSAAAAS